MSEKDLNKIFNDIYSGKISIENIPIVLSKFTFDEIIRFVKEGFGKINSDIKAARMVDYNNNITAFSGAKSFQNVKDLNNLVFMPDGSKRPFKEFKEFAFAINEQYNVNWLKTEQDTAFGVSQGADKWLDIEEGKETFPMLKYQTANDERVRHEHAVWDNIVRPVDDSFWDLHMPPNGWNCYDKETEIYTNEGWKLFKDLNKSEKVLTINPDDKNLEWQKPINYIDYQHKGKMISIEAENMSVCVTEGHRMLVSKAWDFVKGREKLSFKKASELATNDKIYRSSKWVGEKIDYTNVGSLSIAMPIYTRFMAWYLADGSVTKRSDNSYQIKISQNRGDLYDKLINDIEDLPIDLYYGSDYVGFNNTDFGKHLMKFGKCNEKYIPENIKNSSIENIISFLSIYELTDGYRQTDKLVHYYTTSKRLRDDLSEMVIKSGHACSISVCNKKGQEVKHRNGTYTSNYDCYKISQLNSVYFDLSKKRNIREIEYNDNVYCVEVPEHNTLLIKRRGKIYWCGNCRCTVIKLTEGTKTNLRGKPKNNDPMFSNNPGKDKFIFDEKKHPYFKHTKAETAEFEKALTWQ